MWLESLARCHVVGAVVSHEALSRGLRLPHDQRFLIVDEAHRARSPGTRRYAALAELCRGSRALLLSATPIQNAQADLAAELALYLGRAAWSMTMDDLARHVVRGAAHELRGLPALHGPHRIALPPADDCLDQLLALLLLDLPPRHVHRQRGGRDLPVLGDADRRVRADVLDLLRLSEEAIHLLPHVTVKQFPSVLTGDTPTVSLPAGGTKDVGYKLLLPRTPSPVDLMFLVDSTDSTQQMIDGVRQGLQTVVNELQSTGLDAQFGVADFKDYPYWAGGGGDDADYPYRLRHKIEADPCRPSIVLSGKAGYYLGASITSMLSEAQTTPPSVHGAGEQQASNEADDQPRWGRCQPRSLSLRRSRESNAATKLL